MARIEIVVAVAIGEIADDAVGLPQDEAIIVDHRHQCSRVEREKFRHLGGLKSAAPVFTLKWKVQFVAAPQDFAEVDGGGFSEDLDHGGEDVQAFFNLPSIA